MAHRLSTTVLLVVAFLAAVFAAPAGASHDVTPARVAGEDRIDTAAQVARLTHPTGTETAVIARAGDWPDALAGAPFASLIDAPVLLTDSDQLSPPTAQALQDLGVNEVFLLGGEEAIGTEVEQQLEQDHSVQRIAGATRYATAAEIARTIAARDQLGATPGGMRSVFLAGGDTFADALAAGGPASLGPNRMPILLTFPDEIPPATSAALDDLPVEQVLIAGGERAVSAQVAAELEERGLNVVRFAGATRTETAAELADFAVDILSATPEVVTLSRSDEFPDALTAGPLAASVNGPLLLTAGPDRLGDAAEQWLAARCPDVAVVRAVGGEAAIGTVVLDHAEQAAQRCHPLPAELAYESRTGDPVQLITTSIPGGGDTVVTDDLDPTGGYDWSPTGDQFVYVRPVEGQTSVSEIVIVDADGTNARVVTSNGTDDRFPVFSPDGQQILFTRGPALEPESGLFVIGRDGSGLRRIIDEPGVEPLFPEWSPDGTQIVYERFPSAGRDPQIAVIDADGTDLRIVAFDSVRPAWSPDGGLIAFTAARADGFTRDLFVVEPDGTGLRELAADVEGGPVWSPTGQQLAYSTNVTGETNETDLAVVDRDGTDQTIVADVRPLDGSPTWSPDGQTLAFVAAQVEGASDVFTVGVDGTGLEAVTTSGVAQEPRFAPAS